MTVYHKISSISPGLIEAHEQLLVGYIFRGSFKRELALARSFGLTGNLCISRKHHSVSNQGD